MLFIALLEIGHGAKDHITFAGFRPAKVGEIVRRIVVPRQPAQ
jgi:hypothetical protein